MESISLLLVMITVLSYPSPSAAASPVTSFILTSCKPTTYPSLCAASLSAYASVIHRSPRQLAHAALAVSASRAREAAAYVSRFSSSAGSPGHSVNSGAAADGLQDCVVTMADSAARLRRAAYQLRRLGRARGPAFALRLGNVQTWVSAALTDHVTCLASLTEGVGRQSRGGAGDRMRWAVRKKVTEVSRFTSNALSLVNRLGSGN